MKRKETHVCVCACVCVCVCMCGFLVVEQLSTFVATSYLTKHTQRVALKVSFFTQCTLQLQCLRRINISVCACKNGFPINNVYSTRK